MTLARIKYPDILKGKNKQEILTILNGIYNTELRDIAISYYVKNECQIDIAFKYNIERRTVEKYLKKAINEIEQD